MTIVAGAGMPFDVCCAQMRNEADISEGEGAAGSWLVD